jgi:hypothetical protein
MGAKQALRYIYMQIKPDNLFWDKEITTTPSDH